MSNIAASNLFRRCAYLLAQQFFIVDERDDLLMQAHKYDFDMRFFEQIDDFRTAIAHAGEDDLFVVDLDVLYNLQASNNQTMFLGDLLRQLPQDRRYVYLQTRRQSERFLLQRMLVETNCLAYADKPIANDLLIDKLFNLFARSRGLDRSRILYLGDINLVAQSLLNDVHIDLIHHQDPQTLHLAVKTDPPDAVVIEDTHFSRIDALPAVVKRHLETDPSLEMVLLQRKPDARLLERAIDGGFDEVLLAENPPLVTRQLINRLEKLRVNRNLISRDRATGLLNKIGFQKRAQRVIGEAGESVKLACAIVDIDKFKIINDTWGHYFGDIVIKRLSLVLETHMNPRDLLSRFGGEEFVMLLWDTDPMSAVTRVERMRQAFGQIVFEVEEGELRQFSFSGGVAFYPAFRNENELFLHADEMLYRAKQGGRNQVCA